MTLARNLIDAALKADLTKNEYKVFLALFRQTVCFGKTSDPLTLKRLEDLTGVRKDRLVTAIEGVLQAGIFAGTEHKIFGTLYSISAAFLTIASDEPFFAPHAPSLREGFREKEIISENRVHTILTNTSLTQQTTTDSNPVDACEANAVELPYPESFTTHDKAVAASKLDGLQPNDARDCLLVLRESLKAGNVKNPLGYLHTLAQAARKGCLDRSSLQAKPVATAPETVAPNPKSDRIRDLRSKISGLDSLLKYGEIPELQAQKTKLQDELNSLSA